MGNVFSELVSDVRLTCFRNFEHCSVQLVPGFNLIVGANGQGKTNLLESLYLVSTSRLLRSHRDADAIKEGSNTAMVEVDLQNNSSTLGIKIETGVRKRAFVNSASLPKASDLLGRLPCVSVSAVDMEIIRGEPADRRLFLDLEISARSAAYLRHLTIYKRALEQRNALIREARISSPSNTLWETFEEQMAIHGSAMRQERYQLIADLEPFVQEMHERMGSGEELRLEYRAKDASRTANELATELVRSRQSDISRGSSGVGPHRDDMGFLVCGRDAKSFASQGQQRTAVIALKLGTLKLFESAQDVSPLLLLDDIFSDLDGSRRESLVSIVLDLAVQTVLTCTESAAAGPQIEDRAQIHRIVDGRLDL